MFALEGVTKVYPGAASPALADLTLAARPGEVLGFLGPNGAGKTTAIRILCGLLPPDRGRVTVAGIDMWRDPPGAKARVGFVPDDPPLYEYLTGAEFLALAADVYQVPSAQRRPRLEALAQRLQLADALADRIAAYSRGMRQKLAIIASLVHDPPVWVLDEPLIGLDPHAHRVLRDLMRERAAAGGTVFFSTHLLELAAQVCHRVAILHRGVLRAADTPEAIGQGQREHLADVFLEMTAP